VYVDAAKAFNYVVFSAKTPAPIPYAPAPWQEVRVDGSAGYFPNGTLPSLAVEMAFFN